MNNIHRDEFFENTGNLVCCRSAVYHGNMKDKVYRKEYLKKFCPEHFLATRAEIVHDGKVGLVTNGSGSVFRGVDGLITSQPRRLIGVTFADCYPVLYYDSHNGVIGIGHCGYKSLLAGICLNVMGEMTSSLNADPAVTEAYIGPGACAEDYEFGEEAPDIFAEYSGCFHPKKEGKYLVDLKEIIKVQLKKAGIQPENIKDSGICTVEDFQCFSARRDRKNPDDPIEACVYYIGLRENS